MLAVTEPGRPIRRWLGPVAAVLLVGALVGYPLWELFRAALAEGWSAARESLAMVGTGSAIRNTIVVGLITTPLTLAVALVAALVTERGGYRRRAWMRAAMILPLAVPPFVSALSWDRAYGPGGLLDDVVGLTLPGLFGLAGVILVIAVNAVPVAYLIVLAALASRREVDGERAARMAGATGWTAFRTVTLPWLRPALWAAAALVFVLAVNSFGIPAVLGIPAGFATMTTRIYQDLALSAAPEAFTRVLVLATGLAVIALLAVGAVDLKVGPVGATAGNEPAGPAPSARRPRRWPAATLWVYVALTTVLPFLALVLTALTRAVGLPTTPGNWTFANFGEALRGQSGEAFVNSAWLALAAATVVLGLGSLAAAVGRNRWGRGVGTAAVLTFAIPGSALAVAVLLAYGRPLRDSLTLILVAYLAKFWALGHRPIAGSLVNIGAGPRQAARVSGAGAVATVRHVVLPLLAPALMAAWLAVFMFALHELTMSSLLYGPGSETLAVVILNLRQLGDLSVTSALAVILTGAVVAAGMPLLAARRWWMRGRRV